MTPQSPESFQTVLETNICRRLRGPSQLSTPLYSQLILRIYAAMNGLGGGQNWVCPRARETLGTPLWEGVKFFNLVQDIFPGGIRFPLVTGLQNGDTFWRQKLILHGTLNCKLHEQIRTFTTFIGMWSSRRSGKMIKMQFTKALMIKQ